MQRAKFTVGEQVEVLCYHLKNGDLVHDWLPGKVVQVDSRMAAVQFAIDVYSNNGWLIPDRVLWSAHGSPRVRRPGEVQSPEDEGKE